MKKLCFGIICLLLSIAMFSCGENNDEDSNVNVEKEIYKVCEYTVPDGFNKSDEGYGYTEETTDAEAIGADKNYDISYTNKDKKIVYSVILDACENGQGEKYYKALTEWPDVGKVEECEVKGDASTLLNKQENNLRDESTLYEYIILKGENVLRVSVAPIEDEDVEPSEEILNDFKAFLDTFVMK